MKSDMQLEQALLDCFQDLPDSYKTLEKFVDVHTNIGN